MSEETFSKFSKRGRGAFFTHFEIAKRFQKLIREKINPNIIIEPFAGDGTLLEGFKKEKIKLILNELSSKSLGTLKQNFKNFNAIITDFDFIQTPIEVMMKKWIRPDRNDKVLFYSNPPYGTVSTNALATKKSEISSKSRNIEINYENLEQFGKGDLVIPAIGKMINVIQSLKGKSVFLTIFSPLGIFCGRKRYQKLLRAILDDFSFMYGEIVSGSHFESVSKKKPVAFSMWHYQPDISTDLESISFFYGQKLIPLKRSKLLNEYWRYDTRRYIRGEIVVQGNDRFNVVAPKMVHLNLKKGGSELVEENVKQGLNVPNLPDELIFGLWSCAIGYRSLTSHPIYIDNSYVHLPDFSSEPVQEILIFTALSILITEIKNSYTMGKIGVSEPDLSIQFGGEKLTKGFNYLMNTFQNLKINQLTVKDILSIIKNNRKKFDSLKVYKRIFKNEIEKRLELIGYWKYIPVPSNL